MSNLESFEGLSIPDIFEHYRDELHGEKPYIVSEHFGQMWIDEDG